MLAEPVDFIRRNTAVEAPPIVPEIRLYLATEITPIWLATEATLERDGVPPPYWAFAWAGGQALARHILDHKALVQGRRVLDFGAGSGLVSIAAALAGASLVTAAEIDPIAGAAIGLNAALNGIEIVIEPDDVIGRDGAAWDVILVGDMCYERPLADRLTEWLRRLAAAGKPVFLGDPGRTYLPKSGLAEIARYTVPTSLELEDRESRDGIVWQIVASI
jgi:predicted nicotinamide N-methyase